MMIDFKNRQKTKILTALKQKGTQTYEQLHAATGIKVESIRGRLSELKRKYLVEKHNAGFRITEEGMQYLEKGKELEMYRV